MAQITVGGDPESYMEAPTLKGGGGKDSKGNGSFIANLLDLLGVHKQVAKGAKKTGSPTQPQTQAGQTDLTPVPLSLTSPTLPALQSASQAFQFTTPHRGYVALVPPLTQIDPDQGMK